MLREVLYMHRRAQAISGGGGEAATHNSPNYSMQFVNQSDSGSISNQEDSLTMVRHHHHQLSDLPVFKEFTLKHKTWNDHSSFEILNSPSCKTKMHMKSLTMILE